MVLLWPCCLLSSLIFDLLLWPAVIYPSLLQLQKGVTDTEDKKQKAVCMERYRRRDDDENRQCSDIDIEREEECGICMEMNSKIVLPNCNHVMCLKCYREWYCLLNPFFRFIFPQIFNILVRLPWIVVTVLFRVSYFLSSLVL